MSRGFLNGGYNGESSPYNPRSDEYLSRNQIDDIYDRNEMHGSRQPYERTMRSGQREAHDSDGYNSGYGNGYQRNREHRDNNRQIRKSSRNFDGTDDVDMRLSKFQTSSKDARFDPGSDDIERRMNMFKSTSHDNNRNDPWGHEAGGRDWRNDPSSMNYHSRAFDATRHSPQFNQHEGAFLRNETNSDDMNGFARRPQRPYKDESVRQRRHENYGERVNESQWQGARQHHDINPAYWKAGHHPEYEHNLASSSFDQNDGSEPDYYSHPYPSRHSIRDEFINNRGDRHSSFEYHLPNHYAEEPSRYAVREMLPSQMDITSGTLRFRGRLSIHHDHDPPEFINEAEVDQPKTKAEVLEQLSLLREQPWPMDLRRERKNELKHQLTSMGDKWYDVSPVVSVVESGTNKLENIFHTLDPFHSMLKRIEGKHGPSVVAVFNFLRDMMRLNLVLAILLLCGVIVPSAILTEDTDQISGWDVNSEVAGDLCSAIQMTDNSTLQGCNKNYTDKIEDDVERHSTQWIALFRDFLQGTGFLEWSILFSGYYPVTIEKTDFIIGLAYLLTMLVTYFISLVYVVRFVAKFLRKMTSSTDDQGMVFSMIVFTGWDFTVQEKKACQIESSLFIREIRSAFDDEEYIRTSLQRTQSDKIKLYFKRSIINLFILALIGGSWAGIYFLVNEAQEHIEDTPVIQFFWEYAPTLVVAGLNLIFPIIFNFLVTFEQYKGSTELLLTLSRCVLVRLTSLGILIITKVGLISRRDRVCDANDEFICWETHLGQQVYSVLVLDAIIQIGMVMIVNMLRWPLRNFKNPLVKAIGTIEFFVPGHVLDVVYIQAVCWIGLLYSPLIVVMCLLYFLLTFFLKLFTVSVTCVPATRVFRSSRSSAMFMTILALAFLMCLIPNGLALLYLRPSLACSPFRGLDYSWELMTYYICDLSGSALWIKSVLFTIDGIVFTTAIFVLVFLAAVYYISIFGARGKLITELETKLKNASKDKNYLMEEYRQAQNISAIG